MMQRCPRHPPPHARLITQETGPPLYRQLGYADRNCQHSDLCQDMPEGYYGPHSTIWPAEKRQVNFGPSLYGLPPMPLAFTTSYWDDRAQPCDVACLLRPAYRMHNAAFPEERPAAVSFPEMAVPGSGIASRFRNSGYQWIASLPPPSQCRDVKLQGSQKFDTPIEKTFGIKKIAVPPAIPRPPLQPRIVDYMRREGLQPW